VKLYLIVSIDTECDKGPKWKVRQPLRFKNIIEGVPHRLQPLFEEYAIKPTYLLSPEVLDNQGCVDTLRLLGQKVELGTHLHAEFIEPQANWTSDNTDSFQQDFSPEIEFEKLKNLTTLFKDKMGYAPTSFRAGRFGMSKYTLTFLEQLGYQVDSSVTPYMWWWRTRRKGVNFLGAPEQPYYPDPQDFRQQGDMQILEVPVTLMNRFLDKIPLVVLRNLNPINRLQTISLNIFLRKFLRCSWLRPTFSNAEKMRFITQYLSQKVDDQLVLCMMFHSNEATADMSPYYVTEEEVKTFLNRLKTYFNTLFLNFDVQSIGLSDTIKRIS